MKRRRTRKSGEIFAVHPNSIAARKLGRTTWQSVGEHGRGPKSGVQHKR